MNGQREKVERNKEKGAKMKMIITIIKGPISHKCFSELDWVREELR